jgi:hypothetical protein
MLSKPKIILEATSLVLLFSCACFGQEPSESRRVLTEETTVGDVKLPTGTEIILSQQQSPIEALIHKPVKWDGVSIPGETRIIFQGTRASWVIVPNEGVAVIAGSSLSGTIARLPVKSFATGPVLMKECDDSRGWLSPGALPEPKLNKPLRVPSIKPVEKPSVTQRIVTLRQKFESNDFEIPAGSTLAATDDGTVVTYFYTAAKARVFNFVLPPRSLVYCGRSWSTVVVQSDMQAGIFHIRAGGVFNIDANGNVANVRTSGPITLLPEFTVPPGSLVDYEDGLLTYVGLGEAATYRGLKVNSGRYVCFAPDGFSNVPLAEDATFAGKSFPAGTTLIIGPDGGVVRAVLSRPATFDGLQFFRDKPTSGKPIVRFNTNGHVHSGFLNSTAEVGGIAIARGDARFYDDGTLAEGTLNGDQTIAGVPCMGGAYVELDKDGSPIRFTASADWSIGSTLLHRGDGFSGTFTVTGTTVILDNASLNNTLNSAQALIVFEKLAPELRKHAGKFPFGNIGEIIGHDFRVSLAEDHIDLHQEATVKDFLTNPPFADCDSDIQTDITLKWTISNNFIRPVLVMWYSSMSGSISHNFCPGTSFLEAVLEAQRVVGRMFGLVVDSLRFPGIDNPLLTKQFDQKTLAKIHAFLVAAHPNGKVLDWTFKPTRAFIEEGQLKLDYQYEVELQP